MNGFLPSAGLDINEMNATIMGGRYQELRMLIYIGKDLKRWAEQCVDFVGREPQLRSSSIREQSFTTMLVDHPPPALAGKLRSWGINDQRSIFSRAIGLGSVFAQPPEIGALSAHFLEFYQRFADYLFICYQTMTPFKALAPGDFAFELFASDEYAKKLADGWNT